nr:ATP-binding protein [Streptomyces sp. NBC_00974]WSX54889.1 ATP-binding protein [Streptomyces sp. NBC_00974]
MDDTGLLPVGEDAAEAFYRIIDAAYERRSIAVTSNIHPSGWTKTFTDPRLCAAIVDRLTFNGTIIETGTDSYRLASTRARAEESAKAG